MPTALTLYVPGFKRIFCNLKTRRKYNPLAQVRLIGEVHADPGELPEQLIPSGGFDRPPQPSRPHPRLVKRSSLRSLRPKSWLRRLSRSHDLFAHLGQAALDFQPRLHAFAGFIG